MVADVERLLMSPAEGFGWLIRGDESVNGTARRFYSREAGPAYEPFLTIDFTPPPPSTVGDLTGNGVVDQADLAALVAHYGTQSGATSAQGDLNNDGAVGLRDLAILRNAMTTTGLEAAAVPEPATMVMALLLAFAGGATWLVRRRSNSTARR
jgi:hypothetical protein